MSDFVDLTAISDSDEPVQGRIRRRRTPSSQAFQPAAEDSDPVEVVMVDAADTETIAEPLGDEELAVLRESGEGEAPTQRRMPRYCVPARPRQPPLCSPPAAARCNTQSDRSRP